MNNRNRLGRPCKNRKINFKHREKFFKPTGIPLSGLEIIQLSFEEIEALRLKNVENYDQIECAKRMSTSQSTFQRILSSAYEKISAALINEKAIKILKE